MIAGRRGCRKANGSQKPNQARRLTTRLIFLFGWCVTLTPIEARSIADVSAPAVAEVASAAAAIDAATASPTSAAAPAAAAVTAAATPTAATASRLCRRGRGADQDGRRADDVDKHQSQRRKAACKHTITCGRNILSHFRISRSFQSPKFTNLPHPNPQELNLQDLELTRPALRSSAC
jgi:hypothetical protein